MIAFQTPAIERVHGLHDFEHQYSFGSILLQTCQPIVKAARSVAFALDGSCTDTVSYTHLRAHETEADL
eukprot:4507969-Amphidinium_carterae.1